MTKQLDYRTRKIIAKLKLNLKKTKNAAFTEKLSPDRNGAKRSKAGKTFPAFEWSVSGTVKKPVCGCGELL